MNTDEHRSKQEVGHRCGLIRVCLCSSVVAALLISACNELKVSDADIPIVRIRDVEESLNDPATVLIDARKPEAYAAGHLPNAINIYLPDIRESDARLAAAKRIIVYAGGVRDPLGIAAAKRLVAMGYFNVQEFKGGVEEWRNAGRQLIEALPPAEVRPDTAK